MVLEWESFGPVIIFADSQSAVKALSTCNPQSKLTQSIITAILETFQQILNPIEVVWIPAHCEVTGNELADQAARAATGWSRELGREQAEQISNPRILISGVKRKFK